MLDLLLTPPSAREQCSPLWARVPRCFWLPPRDEIMEGAHGRQLLFPLIRNSQHLSLSLGLFKPICWGLQSPFPKACFWRHKAGLSWLQLQPLPLFWGALGAASPCSSAPEHPLLPPWINPWCLHTPFPLIDRKSSKCHPKICIPVSPGKPFYDNKSPSHLTGTIGSCQPDYSQHRNLL